MLVFRKPDLPQDAKPFKLEYTPLKRSSSFLNVLNENNDVIGTYRPEEKILGQGAFGIVSKFKFFPKKDISGKEVDFKQFDLPEYLAIKKPIELDPPKLQKPSSTATQFSNEELNQQLAQVNTKHRQACFVKTYNDYFNEFKAWPHITKLPSLFLAIREVDDKCETVIFDHSSKKANNPIQSGFKKCRLVLPFIKGSNLDKFFATHTHDENKAGLFLKVLLLIAERIKRIHANKYAHNDIAGRNILVTLQDDDVNNIKIHIIDAGLAKKMGGVMSDNYQFVTRIIWKFWPDFFRYGIAKEKNSAIRKYFLMMSHDSPPSIDEIIIALQSKLTEHQQNKNNGVELSFVPSLSQLPPSPTREEKQRISLSESPLTQSPINEEIKNAVTEENNISVRLPQFTNTLNHFGINAKSTVAPKLIIKAEDQSQQRTRIAPKMG